jgi:hypothetical protein
MPFRSSQMHVNTIGIKHSCDEHQKARSSKQNHWRQQDTSNDAFGSVVHGFTSVSGGFAQGLGAKCLKIPDSFNPVSPNK